VCVLIVVDAVLIGFQASNLQRQRILALLVAHITYFVLNLALTKFEKLSICSISSFFTFLSIELLTVSYFAAGSRAE
jgi:hypothetical protein